MQGIKMILAGFLLVLVSFGVLAILAIPDAAFTLTSTFSGLPATPVAQTYGQFDSNILDPLLNFERVGIIVAVALLLAGLVLAGIGVVRKN